MMSKRRRVRVLVVTRRKRWIRAGRVGPRYYSWVRGFSLQIGRREIKLAQIKKKGED